MRQLIASIVLLALMAPALGQEVLPALNFEPVAMITGNATVKDGDGILFGDVEVRLRGIAAPEDSRKSQELGGPESTANLRDIMVGNPGTICWLDGSQTRGRPVGVCVIGWKLKGISEEKDIGRLQVEMGHARDCPRFSGGMYADAEKLAQENGQDLSAIYPLPNYCIK